MIVVTTPFIAGHRVVETKGMVFGLVVRSRGLGGNLMAGLRSLGGGEIHEYTALLEDTRRQALDRLVQNATLMGANAVISMRFDSSELAGTMSEIVAYGTAVVVEPDASAPRRSTPSSRCAMLGRVGAGRWSASSAALMVARRPRRDRRGRPPAPAGAVARRSSALVADRRRRHRAPALPLRGGRPVRPSRIGPGGGEPPGSRSSRASGGPTSVFVDPTTGRRMRVWLDPRTGERRYVAED